MTPLSVPSLDGRALAASRLVWLAAFAAAAALLGLATLEAPGGAALAMLGAAQGLVLIAVATLLFRRRPRDPVAAMLALAFLLWTITSAAQGLAPRDHAQGLEALDRLRFLLLVAAVTLFPDGRFEPEWTRATLAASLAVFLLGLAEALGLAPQGSFLPPAILCVIAAITALIARYRGLDEGIPRQQLKWVALGLASGLVLVLAFRFGGPAASGIGLLALEAAFRLGIMLMALGFLVSLLRFRLYDADAAISRSAAYVALTLVLVAIFAASESAIELVGQRHLGPRAGDFSGAIAAAIAAVLIAPLHERMTRWAERRFQRDLVVLREELPELLADADEHDHVAGLAAAILPRIEAGVRSSRIALAVQDAVIAAHDVPLWTAESWLARWTPPDCARSFSRDPDDPLFPLRIPLAASNGGHFAWILLGPRPDGSFYRRDELEALAAVAAPLRRAIIRLGERENRVASERNAQAALLSRIDILERRLIAIEAIQPEHAARASTP